MQSQTPPGQLKVELEHPHAEFISNFAMEVFGEEEKARRWVNSPRDIFGGRSRRQLIATGDDAQLRRVLQVLIRIDYGVFS